MNYVHLPHVDLVGNYQFITFRTQDSTDAFLKKIAAQNKPNHKKQLEVDDYLDRSSQGAFLNDKVLLSLGEFIKSKDTVLYELVAFCIMPNHVHLLIKPNDKLSIIMQKIKGGSAKLINDVMGQRGAVWASDYYDKVVRDEKHFAVVYQYIKDNPMKLRAMYDGRFFGIYED